MKSADLLTGGFPANYGGRLSSVLDIVTRDGNANRFTGNVAASFLSASAMLEGPLPKGSFFVRGQRTYFDQVLKLVRFDLPYYFYDVQGKAVMHPTQKTTLWGSGFLSNDLYTMSSNAMGVNLGWGNRFATLNWQQDWSPNLLGKTSVYGSGYNLDMGLGQGRFQMDDSINEFGLNSNLTWLLPREQELEAGIQTSLPRFRFYSTGFGSDTINLNGPLTTAAAYVQAKVKPIPNLLVQPGLRLDYYRAYGEFSAQHFVPQPAPVGQVFPERHHRYQGRLGPILSVLQCPVTGEQPDTIAVLLGAGLRVTHRSRPTITFSASNAGWMRTPTSQLKASTNTMAEYTKWATRSTRTASCPVCSSRAPATRRAPTCCFAVTGAG